MVDSLSMIIPLFTRVLDKVESYGKMESCLDSRCHDIHDEHEPNEVMKANNYSTSFGK